MTVPRPAAAPRPIVRSTRLVHRGTVVLGSPTQVFGAKAQPAPPAVSAPAATQAHPQPARPRFRFARPLVAATVLSASLARADGPGPEARPDEVAWEAPDTELAMAPRPEELELVPRLGQLGQGGAVLAGLNEALGAKVDGTKANPYEGKGLIKRVPRAKRIAWKRIYEEDAGYDKMSDLKGNPYE